VADQVLATGAVSPSHEFHHVGYATGNLERDRAFFEGLGYVQEGEDFSDPIQGVKGCFMIGPGPRVELLQNLDGSDTLTPWLQAGIKMYHFAYLVDDLEAALRWARERRGRVTVAPVPAVAFDGRRITFVIFRDGHMLEFIEHA
jgi:methylmalonyl-CoA/ethylmalonyl-CoA epimerase